MIVEQKISDIPRSKGTILVCGLPGSGFVGKIGADHLLSVLEAKRVAEFKCSSFPPQVNVRENGVAEEPRAELYFSSKERPVLIFTADAQPSDPDDEYELCEKVIRIAKKAGVKEVYALAAYITGYFSSTQKVYGAATDRKMLARLVEYGIITMNEGAITGMNGLVIGIASIYGIKGACLLGETSGYVLDAGASQSVLEALSRITKLTIDLTKLKDRAEQTKKVIQQLQRLAEQSREQTGTQQKETRPGYIS